MTPGYTHWPVSSDDLAAAWRVTHRPQHFWGRDARPTMPADLARAFEEAVTAFASRPGSAVKVELRGQQLSMYEIVATVWRCGDLLPERTATALSCIDTFQGQRWLSGKMTYPQAAMFLRAITVH